jgi:hypothetical protein
LVEAACKLVAIVDAHGNIVTCYHEAAPRRASSRRSRRERVRYGH